MLTEKRITFTAQAVASVCLNASVFTALLAGEDSRTIHGMWKAFKG